MKHLPNTAESPAVCVQANYVILMLLLLLWQLREEVRSDVKRDFEPDFTRADQSINGNGSRRWDCIRWWQFPGSKPWTEELNRRNVIVESWEGKRKKYTPIDAALRHLTDKYQAPHFIYMSPEMANVFASFSSFEEWIVKLRLILSSKPEQVHSRLEKFSHRWDSVEEVQARKS